MGVALFPLIDTGSLPLIIVAILGLAFLGMQYGPQAAYFTELFGTEVRYSGASLGYQISAIIGGALAPTIAVLLWNELGIFFVSLYILLAAVLTLWSLSLLEETGAGRQPALAVFAPSSTHERARPTRQVNGDL